MGQQARPARPRAIGMRRRRRLGDRLAAPAARTSRARAGSPSTARGTSSSVSVTSSPSLCSAPPQHGQADGAGWTTRSRGRCSGSGRARRLAPREADRTAVLSACSSAAVCSLRLRSPRSSNSCSSSWSSSGRRAPTMAELLVPQLGDRELQSSRSRPMGRALGQRIAFSVAMSSGSAPSVVSAHWAAASTPCIVACSASRHVASAVARGFSRQVGYHSARRLRPPGPLRQRQSMPSSR